MRKLELQPLETFDPESLPRDDPFDMLFYILLASDEYWTETQLLTPRLEWQRQILPPAQDVSTRGVSPYIQFVSLILREREAAIHGNQGITPSLDRGGNLSLGQLPAELQHEQGPITHSFWATINALDSG